MGEILQKNLEGSVFKFHPDPYPEQQLFYRSDNATLARLGVPAHTISTSKMDNELNYHKASDEIETLDMNNMAEIIKAIVISSPTIVSGKATPTRVGNQREIGGIAVINGSRLNIFRLHSDAHNHRTVPHIIDAGFHGDQCTHLYGFQEIHRVYRSGDAIIAAKFGSAGESDLVHQRQNIATVNFSAEVGV